MTGVFGHKIPLLGHLGIVTGPGPAPYSLPGGGLSRRICGELLRRTPETPDPVGASSCPAARGTGVRLLPISPTRRCDSFMCHTLVDLCPQFSFYPMGQGRRAPLGQGRESRESTTDA